MSLKDDIRIQFTVLKAMKLLNVTLLVCKLTEYFLLFSSYFPLVCLQDNNTRSLSSGGKQVDLGW